MVNIPNIQLDTPIPFDILSAVGFPACPSDACVKVRNIPGIRLLSRKGGDAVVREFAEQLFPELFE